MPVPAAVRYAAMAVWGMLAIGVLRVILTMAFSDELLDAWIADNATYRAVPRDFAAENAPAFTAVALISLVVVALLGLAAFFLPKGARWARVVAVVFAVLSLLGVAAAFLAPSLVILQILNVIAGLLAVAVIVLLFSSDANRFYSTATTAQLQ